MWDLEAGPPPRLPAPVSAVICLAGVTAGPRLGANTPLALAACDLAEREGVPLLLASTQAVYGRRPGLVPETSAPDPETDYGRAKLEMEQAVADRPRVCCLRIGNVAGADMLLGNAAKGPVVLDQFADGQGPRRAYIGPRTLAQTLLQLSRQDDLPPVLNIAQPGLVPMADMLTAAGADWSWRPAPETALPELALDVTALLSRVDLPAAKAPTLVAEARSAGWGR